MDPLSVSRRFRAVVSLLASSPVVVNAFAGTATLPAPPATCGMPLSEFNPLLLLQRPSTPPLNEWAPFVQLRESASVHRVLVLAFVLFPGLRMLFEMLIGMLLNSTG